MVCSTIDFIDIAELILPKTFRATKKRGRSNARGDSVGLSARSASLDVICCAPRRSAFDNRSRKRTNALRKTSQGHPFSSVLPHMMVAAREVRLSRTAPRTWRPMRPLRHQRVDRGKGKRILTEFLMLWRRNKAWVSSACIGLCSDSAKATGRRHIVGSPCRWPAEKNAIFELQAGLRTFRSTRKRQFSQVRIRAAEIELNQLFSGPTPPASPRQRSPVVVVRGWWKRPRSRAQLFKWLIQFKNELQ